MTWRSKKNPLTGRTQTFKVSEQINIGDIERFLEESRAQRSAESIKQALAESEYSRRSLIGTLPFDRLQFFQKEIARIGNSALSDDEKREKLLAVLRRMEQEAELVDHSPTEPAPTPTQTRLAVEMARSVAKTAPSSPIDSAEREEANLELARRAMEYVQRVQRSNNE
jgi:hypothetical protein